MSLVVWLPLTKDLRQQGLSNVTVTNNGATFNSAGKLGGCYSFNGSNNNLTYTPSIDGLEAFSVAIWLCPSASTPTGAFFSLERDTYWQITFTGAVVGIRDNSIGWNGTRKDYSSGTYTANVWTHLAVTYNKGTLKIYRDGVLLSTNTVGGTKLNTGINNARIGSAVQDGYYYNGKINDVRFYDHCLSPMEVKELAKGLVLHYPLNRQGWGQENLVINSINLNNFINESATYVSLTRTSSDLTAKIITTPPSGSRYGFYQDIDCTVSTQYTVSFEVVSMSGDFACAVGSRTGNSVGWSNLSGYTTCTIGKNIKTFTTISDCTKLRIYMGALSNNSILVVKNVKLEKGSVATPWCPNSSDTLATIMSLNSTTEYDCSGFCNNGTRTGTFTWTSDTPKYNVSTVFNGSSCIDTNINYLGNEWSYGGWIYSATSSRSWEGVLMLNGTNPADADLQFGFYTCPKSNIIQNSANGKYNSSISWTYGTWHHFMGTYDGATLKTYIDGVLVNSTGITQAFLERHNFVIGARHSSGTNHDCYFLGNISDVRIYATALSADDVKSLYQNSAYIDSDGTIHGQIR